jgi:hypothetical protein
VINTQKTKKQKMIDLNSKGKNYRCSFLDYFFETVILNQYTKSIDDVIIDGEDVSGLEIIDITHLPKLEQVIIFYAPFIYLLQQDKQEQRYIDYDEDSINYWYIRGIGDDNTYRDQKMCLQFCVDNFTATILENLLD